LWSEADQVDYNWSDFYGNEREAIPPNAPVPLGESVQMTVFVDADHARNLLTRRSRTGVLVYLNRSPILWYTKQQSTVETSSFCSEFCALKTAVEMIKGLRYKLRMMGVEIDGPTQVRVDNQSVVKNSSLPESTLKKKSHSIAYHYVRENVANGTIRIGYESTTTNLADCLSKPQSGAKRRELVSQILYFHR
jgi:hypothetical protein